MENGILDRNKSIYFNWDLHYACNYRCPYCWFHGRWHQLARENKYLSIDEVLKAWENIYKKYGSVYIELLGGEPFIYPNFTKLIKELSNIHIVQIVTNLSVGIEKLIKQVNLSNVNIAPTFHPLFADFDKFIKRLLLLKENGIGGSVVYLAYPPQIKLIGYYMNKFSEYGIKFALLPFVGDYNGISYPEGYTQEERFIIEPYLCSRQGEKFQLKPKSVKGKLCKAGQIYADIKADGKVFRCGGSYPHEIGNLFNDDFKLLDNPLPCESELCPCNEWAGLLVEGEDIEHKRKKTNLYKEYFKEPQDSIPRFPRKDPPYRVYWNWEITYECNYRCSYCFFWKDHKERYPYVEIDKWKEIWDGIFEKYGCCHIRFSGGEPFVYPNFIDLISMLLEKHTVDVTTNLTFDIDCFFRKIPPGGITLSPSFHPEFVKIDEFLDKVILLNKNGFPAGISFVAYPPHLADLGKYKSVAEKADVLFKIIPFMGEFEGREFPESYSEEQRNLLKEAAMKTDNQFQKELNIQWFGQKMNNESKEDKFCRMGQMYARIQPGGEVTRCCHYKSDRLGNIFDDDLRLLDEPAFCNLEGCPCWKAMIVGDQEDKYRDFWRMPEHKVYKIKGVISNEQ